MRRTNLKGHALRGEGMAFEPGGEDQDAWISAFVRWKGVGLCECGAVSPVLESNSDRKAWHAEHKNAIRAQLEASRV